jgi:hypothetical protein
MSQHDMDLANAAGASFRADANLALVALAGNSSGATAPAVTFAYQYWADTTTGLLKQRNAANSAWITLYTLTAGPLDKAGGNLTGGINSARGNITQHATTMDFFAVTSPDILDGTGSAVTITGFVTAPQAGATRTFYPLAGTVLTHGATFDIAGNANLTAAAGDAWVLETKTTTACRAYPVREDGTSVGSSSTAFAVGTATSPEHALRFDQYKNRQLLVDAATGSGSPADTAENILKSSSIPAGILSANGDTLVFSLLFRCAANATTKRIRVYFGATVIADSTAIAHNSAIIVVTGRIIRTGATSQVAYVDAIETSNSPAWSTAITGGVAFTTPAETLSGIITLKATVTLGAGAALNDVIQDSYEYYIAKT